MHFVGHKEVAVFQIEKGRLIRPDAGEILVIRKAALECVHVVIPKLGDPVVFSRRHARKRHLQGVLLHVAADRLLDYNGLT